MAANRDNPEDEFDLPEDGDADAGQPGERRYGGGKYASLDEFEKGYSESFREIERVRAGQMAAEARAAALEVALQNTRTAPPAQPEAPFIEVTDEGVPREQIQRLVAEAARQAVTEALKPLVQGANARTEMLRNAPDFAQHEVQVQQYLAANPQTLETYNRIAAADPGAALSFAYSSYQVAHPAPSAQDKAELEKSRVQSGLPTGGANGRGRDDESAALNPRVYDALAKEARETGNWDKFLSYRLRGVIPAQYNGR